MAGKYGTNFQVNIDDTARSKFVRLLENVEWCETNLPKPDRVCKVVKNIILNGFEGLEI
jgi:hypothetical protein